MKISLSSSIIFLLSIGCSINQDIPIETGEQMSKIEIRAGIAHGGITENLELEQISGVEADAYSGATKIGMNTGVHVKMPVGRNAVETGVDYMLYNQTFTYNDVTNGYNGSRHIMTSQLSVPLTFNFSLLQKQMPDKEFQFKLGYLANVNFFGVNNESGSLPKYSDIPFAHGFTLGLSAMPIQFENGNKFGLYLDMYRGSQVYEDFYNQTSFEDPGTSFLKFGITYQFN